MFPRAVIDYRKASMSVSGVSDEYVPKLLHHPVSARHHASTASIGLKAGVPVEVIGDVMGRR